MLPAIVFVVMAAVGLMMWSYSAEANELEERRVKSEKRRRSPRSNVHVITTESLRKAS
jgi:hypothetical protein